MGIFSFFVLGNFIVASMLVAAANTFTLCVAIPAWRKFSIVAPVAALVISGFAAAPLAFLILQFQHHVFLVKPRSLYSTALFTAISVFAIVLICAFAWAATFICRVVLELLPPFLTATFGLKSTLLLQAALFVGAVCSALEQLVTFGALAYFLRNLHGYAIPSIMVGLATSAICIRVLFGLRSPGAYAPNGIPPNLKAVFLQPSLGEKT